MAKSNGIKSLKQAAKLLNKHSPDGESLAYINPEEGRILKSHGGSGIMTVAGVPSYAWYNPFSWDWSDTGTAGKVWNYVTGRYQDEEPVYEDGKVIQRGQSGAGNLFQDAISIYALLRAKKDQEGLNEAEMSEFNRLSQQLTAGREEFKGYTDEGKQLTAPEYVTTPKAVFSETTGRPDMITTPIATPAEGGRIGAFNGGIQGLMPQQGMPQQGMPQQGFMPQPGLMPPQGLDPRMGYALGDEVEQVTEEITETPENMQMASWEEDYNKWGYQDFLKYQQEGGELPWTKWFNEIYIPMLEKKLGVAQGGRIGAQGGGIMPLLDMGGMEKDYRQDGGFVPIGRKEKADDVPARLSKNEFVFTADAVKAAGGGDIDEGAQRMYNVMKNLEAGGEISQQSQGQA